MAEHSQEASTSRSSSEWFPGFERFYSFDDPLGHAFRATYEFSDGTAWAYTRGKRRPVLGPALLRWADGSGVPGDIIWTDMLWVVVISERLRMLLEDAELTGWRTYRVELAGKKGEVLAGYHGLAITGRCGRLQDWRRTPFVRQTSEGPETWWRGQFFPEDSWDGSDLFVPVAGARCIFASERLREKFAAWKIRNVEFERLSEATFDWPPESTPETAVGSVMSRRGAGWRRLFERSKRALDNQEEADQAAGSPTEDEERELRVTAAEGAAAAEDAVGGGQVGGPSPPSGSFAEQLAPILSAIEATPDEHILGPPASEEDLKEAESRLGVQLPDEVWALYRLWDGPSFAGGNVNLYPAAGEKELSLARATAFLRDHDYPIPEGMVVVGDDGCEDIFGLWLPASTGEICPVVLLEDVANGRLTSMAATSLLHYLLAELAWRLLSAVEDGDASPDALRALSVPEEFWEREVDEKLIGDLRRWADPAVEVSNAELYAEAMRRGSAEHGWSVADGGAP